MFLFPLFASSYLPIPVSDPSTLILKGTNLSGLSDRGAWYHPPTTAQMDFLVAKGVNFFRIPIWWDRLQPSPNGAFDTTVWSEVQTAINYALDLGCTVMINNHCMGSHDNVDGAGTSAKLGSASLAYSALSDFWLKIAAVYGSNDKVWFDLINEPNDMPNNGETNGTLGLIAGYNEVIAALRGAGHTNKIILEGNGWNNAKTFTDDWYSPGTSNATAFLNIVDSGNNWAVSCHNYPDPNHGDGEYAINSTILKTQFQEVMDWATTNNKKVLCGEFSVVADDPIGIQVTQDYLNWLEEHSDKFLAWSWWDVRETAWSGSALTIYSDAVTEDVRWTWIEPYLTGTAYHPLNESGDIFYVSADTGVTTSGGVVTLWADQSANNRNFSQATTTAAPTFIAADAEFNNKPVLSPDGVNDMMESTDFGAIISQPVTYYGVVKWGTFAAKYLFDCTSPYSASARQAYLDNGTPVHYLFAGASVTGGTIPREPYVFSVTFNGASTVLYVNDPVTPNVSGADVGIYGVRALRIFARFSDESYWDGKMAALCAFEGAHDSSTRTRVMDYLRTNFLSSVITMAHFKSTDLVTTTSWYVNTWGDLSGYGRTFTANVEANPVQLLTGEFSGGTKPSIYFPSGTVPFMGRSEAITFKYGFAAFIVFKTLGTDTVADYQGNAPMTILGDSTANSVMSVGLSGGNLVYKHYNAGTWSTFSTADQSLNDGNVHSIAVSHNYTTGDVVLWVNGVEMLTGNKTYSSAYASINRIGVGYNELDQAKDLNVAEIKLLNALDGATVASWHSAAMTEWA